MISNSRKAIVIAFIIIFIVCDFWLLLATVRVAAEKSAAAEIYSAQAVSPSGASETPDEMENNIKAEYSNGSWALRMASGNVGAPVTIVLIAFLAIGTTVTIGIYIHIGNVNRKFLLEKVALEKRHQDIIDLCMETGRLYQ
jgi:hypothetical protein